ncbi:hypothetical protein FKW77_001719 [Venturia effusa]|uniref:Uncharacterized protein n=1 Tax=Venturia effusa TaxID=50376 RepID=A0A517LD92_9PEZI|nr:hypothetical protein FKW77_001719 [Venturia effusa]
MSKHTSAPSNSTESIRRASFTERTAYPQVPPNDKGRTSHIAGDEQGTSRIKDKKGRRHEKLFKMFSSVKRKVAAKKRPAASEGTKAGEKYAEARIKEGAKVTQPRAIQSHLHTLARVWPKGTKSNAGGGDVASKKMHKRKYNGEDVEGKGVPIEQEPVEQGPIEQEPFEQEPFEREPFEKEPFEREPIAQESTVREPIEKEPFERQPIAQESMVRELIKDRPVEAENLEEVVVAEDSGYARRRIVQGTNTILKLIVTATIIGGLLNRFRRQD